MQLSLRWKTKGRFELADKQVSQVRRRWGRLWSFGDLMSFRPTRFEAYVSAVIIVAVTLIGRLALTPLLGNSPSFILFAPAVFMTALWGGLGPGILATILSLAAANVFTADRLDFNSIINDIVFLVIGCAISAMSQWLQTSRER